MANGSPKSLTASQKKQALIMWALLVREDAGAFRTDLKPKLEKKDLEALKKNGLIRTERRRNGRTGGNGTWVQVTDQGWEWAGDNLSSPLPENTKAGTSVLGGLLHRLKLYMKANGLVLVDILDPQISGLVQPTAPAPTNSIPRDQSIRQRIRTAYLDATKGRLNTRALLRDIRVRLSDVDRATLDDALKQMQQDEEVILYQLDNRVELTDADREAAIYFAGEPRHILWIER